MVHELTLGSLTLTGDASFPDPEHDFWFEVCAEGTEFGTPEATTRIVQSFLADGDLVRYDRDGNRTIPVRVRVNGPTLGAVAHGEAALRRETRRRNELTWQPPDYFAPASVYESFPSPMSRVSDSGWDLDESLRSVRTWAVSLTCSPFARSKNAVTVEPLTPPPVTPTVVSIDDGTSTTGWSAFQLINSGGGVLVVDPIAVSTGGGAVTATSGVSANGAYGMGMTRTISSTSFAATRYLTVDIVCIGREYPPYLNAIRDGATVTLAPVMTRATGPDRMTMTWDIGGGSVTQIQLICGVNPSSGPRQMSMSIYDISRTDTLSQVSARQITRVIEVGGTERTPGSLRVAAPDGTTDLSLTIVATWPERDSGFSPPLRRWRVSGNAITGDSATFSGAREVAGPSFIQHDIPITSLPPGTYQLMALMRATTAGPYTMEASIQSRMGGVTLGEVPWSEVVNFPVANDWKWVPMGVYRVPIVAAKTGEFRIIYRAPSTTAVEVDEGWLFPVDEDCGLTSALVAEPHLWLDSPDIDSEVPRVWEGAAADKSNAHFPRYGIHTMGNHIFSPRTAVFTATFGVDNPEAELTFYKRWHSNAAED